MYETSETIRALVDDVADHLEVSLVYMHGVGKVGVGAQLQVRIRSTQHRQHEDHQLMEAECIVREAEDDIVTPHHDSHVQLVVLNGEVDCVGADCIDVVFEQMILVQKGHHCSSTVRVFLQHLHDVGKLAIEHVLAIVAEVGAIRLLQLLPHRGILFDAVILGISTKVPQPFLFGIGQVGLAIHEIREDRFVGIQNDGRIPDVQALGPTGFDWISHRHLLVEVQNGMAVVDGMNREHVRLSGNA